MEAVLYVLTGGAVLLAFFSAFALLLWCVDQPRGSKPHIWLKRIWMVLKGLLICMAVALMVFMAHDIGKSILT